MREAASRQGLWHKASLFAQSIKIEQTLLTLPFAYLTLFLAEGGLPGGAMFGWITLAMAGARTFGMAANRFIDAEIDARNPRTAGRPMPAGLLGRREMLLFMAAAIGLFLLAVFHLSGWARNLWPIVLAAMVFYPYMKRFTWACHFGLAFVYFTVPVGVWVAVTNDIAWGAVLIGLGAACWAAGFDMIYATQDMEVDRSQGLNSFPARFGLGRALWAARVLHLLAVAFIAAAGIALGAGVLYYLGVAAFLLLATYEHRLVSVRDMSRVNVAFFSMNGIISVMFFLFVAADTLTR